MRVTALAFETGGTIDLRDNSLIVDYTSSTVLPDTQSHINAGKIRSSVALNNPLHNTTLGAMEASDFKSIYGPSALFNGQPIDNSAVLVKYTYHGDTDFNGVVNFDDYARIDNGFSNARSGWLNGDFDGNGVVNFDDYSLIDLAFNTQMAPLRLTDTPRGVSRGVSGGGLRH
jgi:hypothetical protein